MVQSEQFKLKPASCTWNERYSTYVHLNSIQALRKTLIIKQIKSLKTTDKKLNVDAADFRPTRNVVAVANLRINDVSDNSACVKAAERIIREGTVAGNRAKKQIFDCNFV